MKTFIARLVGLDTEISDLRTDLARAERSRDDHKHYLLHEKARAEFYKQERDTLLAGAIPPDTVAEIDGYLVEAKQVMGMTVGGAAAGRAPIDKALSVLRGER